MKIPLPYARPRLLHVDGSNVSYFLRGDESTASRVERWGVLSVSQVSKHLFASTRCVGTARLNRETCWLDEFRSGTGSVSALFDKLP